MKGERNMVQEKFKGQGYIGKTGSVNAQQAYEKGKVVLSQIDSPLLKKYGIPFSVDFFRWLVEEKYIVRSEWHHTGPNYRVTDFYDMTEIIEQLRALDVYTLHPQYQWAREQDQKGYFALVTLPEEKATSLNRYVFLREGWLYCLNQERQRMNIESIRIQQRFMQKPPKLSSVEAAYLLEKAGVQKENFASFGIVLERKTVRPALSELKDVLLQALKESDVNDVNKLFEELLPKVKEKTETKVEMKAEIIGCRYVNIGYEDEGKKRITKAVIHGENVYTKDHKKLSIREIRIHGGFHPSGIEANWVGHVKHRISTEQTQTQLA